MIDFRTKSEKARAERCKRICSRYLSYSSENPTAAPHRIFGVIADEEGMTVPGVKNIIVNNGLYQCRSKQ